MKTDQLIRKVAKRLHIKLEVAEKVIDEFRDLVKAGHTGEEIVAYLKPHLKGFSHRRIVNLVIFLICEKSS